MISLFKIRVFNPRCFVPPFFLPSCNLPIFSFLPSRMPYSGTQIISRGSRSTIVQSPYHSRGVRCTIGNTQKWNTCKIPRIFNFTRKKRVYRNIFGKKLRTEYVLLIYFQQFISFCAFIYSNTNSHQLFCENSYLNLANLAIFVNHCVNSGQFYPIPKTFYTSATCDKFHVWTQLSGGLGIDLSNQLKSNFFLLKLMIIRMYFP